MLSRRDAAIRLDIPVEMATRHGIPTRMTPAELDALEASPPAWLTQSRANRTGKPVWVTLTCAVCGTSETARPKKWWPEYTYLLCEEHFSDQLPAAAEGMRRDEVDGIGDRFTAIIDWKL
jgi:hypothetical protein